MNKFAASIFRENCTYSLLITFDIETNFHDFFFFCVISENSRFFGRKLKKKKKKEKRTASSPLPFVRFVEARGDRAAVGSGSWIRVACAATDLARRRLWWRDGGRCCCGRFLSLARGCNLATVAVTVGSGRRGSRGVRMLGSATPFPSFGSIRPQPRPHNLRQPISP